MMTSAPDTRSPLLIAALLLAGCTGLVERPDDPGAFVAVQGQRTDAAGSCAYSEGRILAVDGEKVARLSLGATQVWIEPGARTLSVRCDLWEETGFNVGTMEDAVGRSGCAPRSLRRDLELMGTAGERWTLICEDGPPRLVLPGADRSPTGESSEGDR